MFKGWHRIFRLREKYKITIMVEDSYMLLYLVIHWFHIWLTFWVGSWWTASDHHLYKWMTIMYIGDILLKLTTIHEQNKQHTPQLLLFKLCHFDIGVSKCFQMQWFFNYLLGLGYPVIDSQTVWFIDSGHLQLVKHAKLQIIGRKRKGSLMSSQQLKSITFSYCLALAFSWDYDRQTAKYRSSLIPTGKTFSMCSAWALI